MAASPHYPLAVSAFESAELEAFQKVIDSGRFTMGPYVSAFEDCFADYFGSQHCVMVNSGSSANLLAVAALFYRRGNSLKKGDEVVVPAISWSTTYYPLYQYGLKLKFVDIDLHTLNYDLQALAGAITDRTKMIVVVNLLGNPNDFKRIDELVNNRDIVLIEDNCESMGAQYNGKYTGTFGLLGTFSTFFSHHISTMEGGIIVTDDEELYHILLSLRAHGWTRDLPEENTLVKKNDSPFLESFRFILPGYNVRPMELSGAIGLEQLKKFPAFLQTRRENAVYFQQCFQDYTSFIIQSEIGMSSWFGFSLIIEPETQINRPQVISTLIQNNIEARPIVAGNILNSEVVRWFDHEVYEQMINADIVDSNGFFVGNCHLDLRAEIDHLYATLSRIA